MTGFDADRLDWQKTGGLIPAIIQDGSSGQVLMLGYMNREALEKTLETRRVTFWSRSRNCLWTKGETSGNFLTLEDIAADCDEDTLLLAVRPAGPVCHEGTRSCFGADDRVSTAGEFPFFLERLIAQRKRDLPEDSYTTSLFRQGMPRIGQKLGEEAVETILSVLEDRRRTIEETADLLYHLLVFLAEREVTLDEVVGELQSRHGR
ncbi:MAG: bifunctional phosphoribosyl-AMP cyclohydrolase/phosphoribosyl-ATP diphosphatase HisIE [Acidobacteriota bacterium]